MCGIFGVVSAHRHLSEWSARKGLDAQSHRGPDAEGTWSDGYCTLGHRRLAIIDLSEAGRQPLSNEDETIWITFNGEIYNFEPLRAELEQRGHRFRTRTDTEAIVHAYEEWGTACVDHLRGMFAFAVWDSRMKRLYAARDRVGKKPICYTQAGDDFWFSSELQGLLANAEIRAETNLTAIDTYLSWGYIPAPESAYEGIHKLPAAHWMTVDVSDGSPRVHVERYWSLAYGPKLALSEDEACEAIREKIQEAVRIRLMSDVPLGAFLSGGVDSSIVVGLMAQLSGDPVKTFSIGFEEEEFNELEHARRVANRWGTDHHEFVVRPDALEVLPSLAQHFGEPFADEAALPTYYLSQMTRSHVTVALNGDGGDECFVGYHRYVAHQVAQRMSRIPGVGMAARTLTSLVPETSSSRGHLARARRFLAVACKPPAERYGAWQGFFSEEEKSSLYAGNLRETIASRNAARWMENLFTGFEALEPADAAMAVDVESYLPYDLLTKVDITSMAHSLEARSPFLDHEVMELAARLPVSQKLKGGRPKSLLKRACADLLPPENANRGKMGFGVPVGRWFRGPLRDFLTDTLLSHRSIGRGYFQPNALRTMVDDHVSGRRDRSLKLWNLLILELWHREVTDVTFPSVSLPV